MLVVINIYKAQCVEGVAAQGSTLDIRHNIQAVNHCIRLDPRRALSDMLQALCHLGCCTGWYTGGRQHGEQFLESLCDACRIRCGRRGCIWRAAAPQRVLDPSQLLGQQVGRGGAPRCVPISLYLFPPAQVMQLIVVERWRRLKHPWQTSSAPPCMNCSSYTYLDFWVPRAE